MQSKFGMMGSTLSRRRHIGNIGIVSADSGLSRSLLFRKVQVFRLRRQGKWLRGHGILKLTRQQSGLRLAVHIRITPIGALPTHPTPTRPITDSGEQGSEARPPAPIGLSGHRAAGLPCLTSPSPLPSKFPRRHRHSASTSPEFN